MTAEPRDLVPFASGVGQVTCNGWARAGCRPHGAPLQHPVPPVAPAGAGRGFTRSQPQCMGSGRIAKGGTARRGATPMHHKRGGWRGKGAPVIDLCTGTGEGGWWSWNGPQSGPHNLYCQMPCASWSPTRQNGCRPPTPRDALEGGGAPPPLLPFSVSDTVCVLRFNQVWHRE